MTNPIIDGFADGCSVVGTKVGDAEGKVDGVGVMNTE